MEKSKKTIITALFCLTATSVMAVPSLPETCSAFRPRQLEGYTIKESTLLEILSPQKKKKMTWGQDGPSTGKYWIAFSDRSQNTTYETPSEKSPCGKLDFNEEVRIAMIENGFALVYTEEQRGTEYPSISRRAKCKGWIPMKHLLLWTDCPTNEFGIYNKALIVGNIDKMKSDTHVGKIYKNPITKDGETGLRSSMNFFFAMKKDEDTGLVLLAKESRVGGKIKDVLYGWVSPSMYAAWSQRTCLEPNWDENAVSDLRGTKIPVYIQRSVKGKKASYSNPATEIEIGARKNSVSSNNPATQYRLDPKTLRYPLLENLNGQGEDYFKTTAFTSMGGQTVSVGNLTEAQDKLQRTTDDLRVVNIIVVIDGTKGMEKYFPAAMEAIRRADDYFGKENRNVRAGVVIYRDYADGEYVTECLSLRSAKDISISDFLKKGGRYGIKNSSSDKTDTEALFKGLEVALDAHKMGYKPDNSNLMFVIGDCGNDPSDTKCPSQEALIDKLVENHIQLLSFQVRNIQSRAYNLFRKQTTDLVVENMKRQYAKLGKGIKLKYKEIADGYDAEFDVKKESTFFLGGIRNAQPNKEMDVSRLYALVMSTSQKFNETVSVGEDALVSVENNDEAISAINKEYVIKRIGQNAWDALMKQKYLMAFEGYVPRKSGNNLEYWQPVIYISQPEYLMLMEQLKPVMEAANKHSDERKPYVDAMKALVRSMLPDISKADMDKMDNTEIMDKIMGLNVRTNALASYTLIDIQNEQKVSKQQFDELISQFKDKYEKLEFIGQGTYAFSTKRNNIRWFWIPAYDLP